MQLEKTSCYNCGSVKSVPYDTENGFFLVKCSDCGLVYMSPRPTSEELTAATRMGLHHGEADIDVTGSFDPKAVPNYIEILCEFFPGNMGEATWLDIGCGHGEFLSALDIFSKGTVASRGCEPNRHKVESAKKRGIDADFFDLLQHGEQYDYVSMLNVYSHLPDPVESILEWKNLIKPSGSLLLETGHSCHLSPQDHHKPYYLPDHLSFANSEILKSILKRTGFDIIKWKIYRSRIYHKNSLIHLFIEILNLISRKKNRLIPFFPKEPDRDMYILCKREN